MTICGGCPSLVYYCASAYDMHVYCFDRYMMREYFFVSVCGSHMHRFVAKIPKNRRYLKKSGLICNPRNTSLEKRLVRWSNFKWLFPCRDKSSDNLEILEHLLSFHANSPASSFAGAKRSAAKTGSAGRSTYRSTVRSVCM